MAQISKPVFAHFMVGNTYPYTIEDWRRNINLASSKGIDGFVLNVGRDGWQPERVEDAYRATEGTSFKMALSFDMTSLPCGGTSDIQTLSNYINRYGRHRSQLQINGRPLVTTFGGQTCRFGQGTLDGGWGALKAHSPSFYFMPAFFIDPALFGSIPSADGAINWNSAWPAGNYDITRDSDISYKNALGGRSYMATVSPWFFTHYGANSYNKNMIFRCDNWLLVNRWETLVSDRDSTDIVQILSWNDYGESHYMGPIDGAQPQSESWTTGFDHQGWLDLQSRYITAYKTGRYPAITRDRIFLWGRLYPAQADAHADPVGKPWNHDFTEDFVWAIVLLTSDARVSMRCGDSAVVKELPRGSSKVRLKLENDCRPVAEVVRNGNTVLSFSPEGYQFSTNPPTYNYNAFVAASP